MDFKTIPKPRQRVVNVRFAKFRIPFFTFDGAKIRAVWGEILVVDTIFLHGIPDNRRFVR